MYRSSNLWLKKSINEDLDNVIFDFRERLKVKKEPPQQQQYADESISTNQEYTEKPLKTLFCPTCDPFRNTESYERVMELLQQGNLIKEAVKMIKTNRRGKQLKRLSPSR